MRAIFLQPILFILIISLLSKASVLFGRIQLQTNTQNYTSSSSILVDTAYAGGGSKKKENKYEAYGTIRNSEEQEKHVQEVVRTQMKGLQMGSGEDEFTQSEIDLLKELAKRRERLKEEEKDLAVRKQVLKATEERIEQKIHDLKILQNKLETLMASYDKKEHGKIMSLVKIYETMKPKDAAKIFNELEMEVLIRVVSNMKEVKLAPIIASMAPIKARELSMELAKEQDIN